MSAIDDRPRRAQRRQPAPRADVRAAASGTFMAGVVIVGFWVICALFGSIWCRSIPMPMTS